MNHNVPKMCVQVVERYSVCRCLYYKHAIDPCVAHGQRGHAVQEKTVLVGYACSSHSSHKEPYTQTRPFGETSEAPDFLYDSADSTDESDGGESVFSNVLSLSRATSFISGEEDTIKEILDILLEDPLLRWEKLLSLQRGDGFSETKDVRFFLRAFEMDLRANANNTLEHHTCAFFRSRIRYFSSQICERFDLRETEDETASEPPGSVQTVTMEEPDLTLMPPFSRIRNFLFGGEPFQGLKDNVKNFTVNNTRDHLGEMINIVTRNIHPPEMILGGVSSMEEIEKSLRRQLQTFVLALAEEADLSNLSASDRNGIRSVNCNMETFSREIGAYWIQKNRLGISTRF
jgi:hypothetical protein